MRQINGQPLGPAAVLISSIVHDTKWFLISGVIPANQDSHEFVMKNRTEQYGYLKRALQVMRRIDDNSPQSEVFLKMFLTEEGLLPFKDTDLVIVIT